MACVYENTQGAASLQNETEVVETYVSIQESQVVQTTSGAPKKITRNGQFFQQLTVSIFERQHNGFSWG